MLIRALILWLVRRTPYERRGKVVTFEGKYEFRRFAPFWGDEFVSSTGKHHYRPPCWRPFNVLLHHWRPDKDEGEPFHDHPRWSVTICLKGRIVERSPWTERVLRPGSVVIRSRKAIHSFRVPAGYSGKTWTLFIVGRRNFQQNTYQITPRTPGGRIRRPPAIERAMKQRGLVSKERADA